jgi:hypothetical protein
VIHLKGYRELPEETLQVLDAIEELGLQLDAALERIAAQHEPDPRWLAIARTDLQTGFMALNRAIAKPEGF